MDGAPTEWSTENCPLAKKCPYYDKIRSDPSKLKNCPVAAGCPHAAKSLPGDYKDAVKKCPHLAGLETSSENKIHTVKKSSAGKNSHDEL
jgi:hypothetical protein